MTVDTSIQQLCDKASSKKAAIFSRLKETSWPPESKEAVDSLNQTIMDLPHVSPDASVASFKDSLVQYIRVLEGAHARLNEASEKYGGKKGGLFSEIKGWLHTPDPRKCTDTLWGCRGEIERASTKLRSYLNNISTSADYTTGLAPGTEMPAETPQPSAALVQAHHYPELLDSSRAPQTRPSEQIVASDYLTSQPMSLQDSSPCPVGDGEELGSFRDKALTVARKTFEAVDAASGAIPGVGGYVGVAAKVGLAFVNMIETMDENEDVSNELTSHTSKLSSYLQHFAKTVDADQGDDMAAHLEGLHKELKCVQEKVKTWNSLGRFKKAFLASDHANVLKANQNTVQTALEEMQLLVSLKTTDLVVELKDTVLRAERTRLLDRLGDANYGARGNSIADAICLPGTRVELIDRISEWIRDPPTPDNRVLWIRGMAGRGKSTVASTVAHNWASKGSCAIFHFRRGQHAVDGQFVCALARQLGKDLVPEVKNAILDCVRKNEDIAKERLEQQFKTIFIGSLGKIQNHTHPIVIIVDALDECQNIGDVVHFIQLIDQYSSSLPVNVKFLLTCRPEPPLILALELKKRRVEDLDSASHTVEDIRRFIQHAFVRIRDKYQLPQSWPSSANLDTIVEMSQELFQWARTAIAYIDDGSPSHRLQELLEDQSEWGGLDDLYHQILSRAFQKAENKPQRKQMLSWVLGTLVVAPHPVTLEVIAFLHADHKMFKGKEDIVRFIRDDILENLNSLLYIPKSKSEPVRLMHTSIRDLLVTREGYDSRHYSIDPVQHHRRLTTIILQIMERDLKQNICNLPGISKANSEIQDAVDRHIPPGLRYSCRSFFTHVAGGVPSSEATGPVGSTVLEKFKQFSDEKVLFWLEVMSLIGAMAEAYAMAKQTHQWLLEWSGDMSDDSLKTLWHDTERFIAAFFNRISSNAWDIYSSALPQAPVETKLWREYHDQATAWILVGKRQRNWSANIWTVSATAAVSAVAFSPDGKLLASGLRDKTIQIRDAQTGAPLGDPLTGHSDWITSVAFSPDGKLLVSGSDDKTVRLWDSQARAPLGDTLIGHSKSITSVVFSPDGENLASGSHDGMVRLWNVQTKVQLPAPLTGHGGLIMSVTFSPDGKTVASGSGDNTIRLWNAQTGALLGDPLTGHSDRVSSVLFSPDGKILASGSDDNTVRLWDAQTRVLLGDPLTGHTDWVRAVVFSPDGVILASGSHDKTIRLWNVRAKAQLGAPLTGHSAAIASVVFSPDGKVLASGSHDETVRLWDVQVKTHADDSLTGHGGRIASVALSPDGTVLASGSSDKTVRLWDAQTGAQLGNPLIGSKDSRSVGRPRHFVSSFGPRYDQSLRGRIGAWLDEPESEVKNDLLTDQDGITSVAFSPDGMTLASGSYHGKTVQLWNVQTGALSSYPPIGYKGSIMSVVFSPDGKILVSGSGDGTIQLWDGRTGIPSGNALTGHNALVNSVVFSPDGKILASGSDDTTIRLWDMQTRAPLGDPLTGHNAAIKSVAFSPDGKILASGSHDKTVRLWNVQAGAQLGDPLSSHSASITSVVFSPDGNVLASGSNDKTVRLWDARTGAPLGDPLSVHTSSITWVMFSPDGKVLLSASSDGMIRFWEPSTFKPVTAVLSFNSFTCSRP